MGYKKVCFNCRKAFSIGTDFSVKHGSTCPECGQRTFVLQHSFRPPSSDNIKAWEVVEFLKDKGFIYQHIYTNQTYAKYPATMDEAIEFVTKYKDQACDPSKIP